MSVLIEPEIGGWGAARHLPSRLRRLRRSARGAVTIWMVFWSVAFLLLGGVAVDGAKAWRIRAALQAAADAASHAGAMALPAGDVAAARSAAIARAEEILPPAEFGTVLTEADVEIGRWDSETRTLLADGTPDTVRVRVARTGAGGNAEPTMLLRLGGIMGWDVAVSSTARATGGPNDDEDSCWRNGLIARGVVDSQSNNVYRKVCIHGQAGVKVSSNSSFSDNTVVSMPDLALFQMPASGFSTNAGLEDALQEAERDPWIVDYVDEMIYHIRDNSSTIWIPNQLFNPRNAAPGATYWVYCTGSGGTMTIPQNITLTDTVILTNCAVRFRKSVVLINTLIGTTGDRMAGADGAMVAEDGDTTITGTSELRLGMPDGCTPGGGARLLIDGDFKNPAKLRINGSQIIASGDVDIAAQGESIEGLSVYAGGDIDITSNNYFALCDQVDFDLPAVETRISLVQ